MDKEDIQVLTGCAVVACLLVVVAWNFGWIHADKLPGVMILAMLLSAIPAMFIIADSHVPHRPDPYRFAEAIKYGRDNPDLSPEAASLAYSEIADYFPENYELC